MQETFKASSARAAVGLRAGITGTEMADTLEALFGYFKNTLQDSPALLSAIENEAKEWRGNIATLRGGDQAAVDNFFGQPASKDIIAKLAEEGITRPDGIDPDFEYGRKVSAAIRAATVDPQSYLPGKVVPTLSEYRALLKFAAYREELDGDANGPARTLLQKIDAFQGGFGGDNLAGGGLGSAINTYISHAPRHPSEVYVQPENVKPDYLNAFDHTYTSNLDWKPSADMRHVTAVKHQGYGGPDEKNEILAWEKAKFEAALIERGGIDATVEVKLGKTGADDTVVVTMSMEDYTTRYIPIMQGKIKIDTSIPGSSRPASFSTNAVYNGFEPGKQVFFEKGNNIMISAGLLGRLESGADLGVLNFARDALQFLRNAHALAETPLQMPVAPGETAEYVRLKPLYPDIHEPKIYKFGTAYYTSANLHNKINEMARILIASASGRVPPAPPVFWTTNDTVSFEHNGNTYLPVDGRSYQTALHMKYQYGIDFSSVTGDEEVKKKAGGKEKYEIKTSLLPPEIRDAALSDLKARIAGHNEQPAPEKASFKKHLRLPLAR